MPTDFIATENKICDKAIGYHFGNGKIHDTNGDHNKKSTAWRIVTDPLEDGITGVLTLEIDSDSQLIYWKFNDHQFAESTITNYLKGKKCSAYISMLHVNDEVMISPRVPGDSARLSIQSNESKEQNVLEEKKSSKKLIFGR